LDVISLCSTAESSRLFMSVFPGFSPEMKIADVQSLWPSPYFIACFTRFGRTFVRLY
jgi:hypothetical protein